MNCSGGFLCVVVNMGDVVTMVMAVSVFVLAVDVIVGMDMGVFVGVDNAVMAVGMGVLMDVLMVMLQGNGILDHQHGGDHHDGESGKELKTGLFGEQQEAEGNTQEGGRWSSRRWSWRRPDPFGP
jgi:hypothetical protein